jgi:hypothetical protein
MMKLSNKKCFYFLATLLMFIATTESQAGLSRNITPKYMDNDLTSDTIVKSLSSLTLTLDGIEFAAKWKEGTFSLGSLVDRIHSLTDKTYVTLSQTAEFVDGKLEVPNKIIKQASESHIYEFKFFDNGRLGGDPLATLYLGGKKIPFSILDRMASTELLMMIAELKAQEVTLPTEEASTAAQAAGSEAADTASPLPPQPQKRSGFWSFFSFR